MMYMRTYDRMMDAHETYLCWLTDRTRAQVSRLRLHKISRPYEILSRVCFHARPEWAGART